MANTTIWIVTTSTSLVPVNGQAYTSEHYAGQVAARLRALNPELAYEVHTLALVA